jgi:hypothetical protein
MRFAGGYDLARHSGQQKRRASRGGSARRFACGCGAVQAGRRAADLDLSIGQGQIRSYRSRLMTLSNAATKSCTNFSFASSLA